MPNGEQEQSPEAKEAILHERYPARRVLSLIANKWTPIVIHCLASGTRHFGEMQRRIPGLSKKMLTQVLRRLERQGLVARRVLNAVPPRTDYQLTSLGERLHEPIAIICEWANENESVLAEIKSQETSRSRWSSSGKQNPS